MIVSQPKTKGRKRGSKNLVRRTPQNPRVEKHSRTVPRRDLTVQEFNVMKERLKFQMPSEAAMEPRSGKNKICFSISEISQNGLLSDWKERIFCTLD